MKILITVAVLALGALAYMFFSAPDAGTARNTITLSDATLVETTNLPTPTGQNTAPPQAVALQTTELQDATADPDATTIYLSETVSLPLPGSAPTANVRHTIPIEEIRRGCFRQDCIPSVDEPEFISPAEADELLPPDTIGIALSYKSVGRFYPFPMLETHEIVNDTVAGDPLLVTYCPLCGTGIVFRREVGGEEIEFGVSGMLWQSNLLMYNRANNISDRNLWSQVLGEAVVGDRAGEELEIIPSDIVRYQTWRANTPGGEVLTTGFARDPYGGDYFSVARSFNPNFDETVSPLVPTAYVYGIELNGETKAYPREALPIGITSDIVGGETVSVMKAADDTVIITDESGAIVPDVEGFWFSWIAAHPETGLWTNL